MSTDDVRYCMTEIQVKMFDSFTDEIKNEVTVSIGNGMPVDLALVHGADRMEFEKPKRKRSVIYKPNRHDRRRAEALARKDRGHA